MATCIKSIFSRKWLNASRYYSLFLAREKCMIWNIGKKNDSKELFSYFPTKNHGIACTLLTYYSPVRPPLLLITTEFLSLWTQIRINKAKQTHFYGNEIKLSFRILLVSKAVPLTAMVVVTKVASILIRLSFEKIIKLLK